MDKAASNSRPLNTLNSGDLFMLVNDAEHRVFERLKAPLVDGASEINQNGVAVDLRVIGQPMMKTGLVPVVVLLARPPKVQ